MHKPFTAHQILMLVVQIFIFGKNVPSSKQEIKIYFPVNSILWILVISDIAVKKETYILLSIPKKMLMTPQVSPSVLLVAAMEKGLIICYINSCH